MSGDDRLAAYLDEVEAGQLEQLASSSGSRASARPGRATRPARLRGVARVRVRATPASTRSRLRDVGQPRVVAEARSDAAGRTHDPRLRALRRAARRAGRGLALRSLPGRDPRRARLRTRRVGQQGADRDQPERVARLPRALRVAAVHLGYVIEGDEERSAEPLAAFAAEPPRAARRGRRARRRFVDARAGVPAVTTASAAWLAIDFSVVDRQLEPALGHLRRCGAERRQRARRAAREPARRDRPRRRGRLLRPRRRAAATSERARWAAFAPGSPPPTSRRPGRATSPARRRTRRSSRSGRGRRSRSTAPGAATSGEGIHTIVPARAHAKITCRLVPDRTAGDHRPDRGTSGPACPQGAELVDRELARGPRRSDARRLARHHRGGRRARERLGRPAVVGRAGYSVPAAELLARCAGGQRVPDGVRPRERAGARARRALPPRELPQGHRGDRRLLARATGAHRSSDVLRHLRVRRREGSR